MTNGQMEEVIVKELQLLNKALKKYYEDVTVGFSKSIVEEGKTKRYWELWLDVDHTREQFHRSEYLGEIEGVIVGLRFAFSCSIFSKKPDKTVKEQLTFATQLRKKIQENLRAAKVDPNAPKPTTPTMEFTQGCQCGHDSTCCKEGHEISKPKTFGEKAREAAEQLFGKDKKKEGDTK